VLAVGVCPAALPTHNTEQRRTTFGRTPATVKKIIFAVSILRSCPMSPACTYAHSRADLGGNVYEWETPGRKKAKKSLLLSANRKNLIASTKNIEA
jgi:hypothetical protein